MTNTDMFKPAADVATKTDNPEKTFKELSGMIATYIGRLTAIGVVAAFLGYVGKTVVKSISEKKKKKRETEAIIEVEKVKSTNKQVEERAKCDAQAEQYRKEREYDVACHEAKNRSDIETLREKESIKLEYAQKMAKFKQDASNKDYDSTQPCSNWVPPCSYDKMLAGTDIQTSPIVPGFIEEGQINFLVGGAGVAKSMLMRQLALAVDTGGKIGILPDFTVAKRAVMFCRLEEFANEEQGKYGCGGIFANSGIMWRTKSDFTNFTLKEIVNDLIQLAFRIEDDMVAFFDPITKPNDYNAEKFIIGAEQAMNIAKKKGHTLTIVVSAHLEELEPWKSTTTTNIKGGDVLIQKAGSVTAICRERTSKDHRFLKCLKAPKGYPEPDDVVVCKIEKQEIDEHNWNTRMSYVCRKKEEEALPIKPKSVVGDSEDGNLPHLNVKDEFNELIEIASDKAKMREKNKTKKGIAKEIGVSRPTLDKRIRERNKIEVG